MSTLRIISKNDSHPEGVCHIKENGVPCARPVYGRGVCGMHYKYLRSRGDLDSWALPSQGPLKPKPYTYAVKSPDRILPDICRIIAAEVPCTAKATHRGCCSTHYKAIWARKDLRLEDYVIPVSWRKPESFVLGVKSADDLEDGVCRLIEDGNLCPNLTKSRGICEHHIQILRKRPDLNPDDFKAPKHQQHGPPKMVAIYALKAHEDQRPGICRISVNGVPCTRAAGERGTCKSHQEWITRRKLDEEHLLLLPAPVPRAPEPVAYTLRTNIRPGICRVQENGIGCERRASSNGLCRRHNGRSRRYASLARLALPATIFTVIEQPAPGTCRVGENGMPCSRPATYRGVCHYHGRALRASPTYQPMLHGTFYLPIHEVVYTLKTPIELQDDLCRVSVDGTPCLAVPQVRGLCKIHHRIARDSGRMDELGKPSCAVRDPMRRLYGAGNDVPHVYLDKNIQFDALDSVAFDDHCPEASWRLVSMILEGQMIGTISTDAVKVAYNRLRYRAVKSVNLDGLGYNDIQAEEFVRKKIRDFYFTPVGGWRIITIDAPTFRTIFANATPTLSLEDALEWQVYQQARTQPAKPQWFVTRDVDFPEGVRPEAVLEAIAHARTWGTWRGNSGRSLSRH